MELTRLSSHQALVTEISDELLNLALFLEIPADIDLEDNHIYIADKVGELSLESFYTRRESDIRIPNETFSEILLDIKAGMTVLKAFNKQGYTFY